MPPFVLPASRAFPIRRRSLSSRDPTIFSITCPYHACPTECEIDLCPAIQKAGGGMKIFTGQSLRTLLNTPTAHSLLAPFGQCGWTDGGCAILADALLTFLPGSMPVLVVSEKRRRACGRPLGWAHLGC